MFEKRQDDISCWAVAEAGGIGPAAGSAAVTPSAPSQSPSASSAVCTSRHRTTQASRVSTTASQPNAPPAIGPASARASAPVATGDLSSPPSPTSTCPARAGPAPPRPLGPGVDTRFRRRLVRAALHRMHARRHAPGGAGHSGTRHHAGGAVALRGRDSGRERWCLVVMGDPVPVRVAGPRTVVRYCPSTRIPLPSHAAAAACLATSGPPAFRHPPSRALSVSPDTTGTAPRPARHVAPRPGSRHAGLPGRRGLPAPRRPSWPSWSASVRALPRMWRTVPCDASTAYAAALQQGTGAALGAAITRRALRPGNVACGDSDCGAP